MIQLLPCTLVRCGSLTITRMLQKRHPGSFATCGSPTMGAYVITASLKTSVWCCSIHTHFLGQRLCQSPSVHMSMHGRLRHIVKIKSSFLRHRQLKRTSSG